MKVLDTDICVDLLRGDPATLQAQRLVRERLAITWVNAAELYYGAARSSRAAAGRLLVDRFLASLPMLMPNRRSALEFGRLKAGLEAEGRRLADADLFIAAICLARDAVLVTRNRRHFERVPGLGLESWA